ncbi:MAG: hypothetical protein AABN95_23060 [Acidobacteriota bacterium]
MLTATHICNDRCPETEPSLTRVRRFTVLCVGCDLESLSALRRNLEKQQVGLVGCSDRGGAILFLKSQIEYNLLLFDVDWQGAEGFRLIRMAHSLRHRKQTPVILLNATNLVGETGLAARKTRMPEDVECMPKTPDMAGVIEAIKRLLVTEELGG